MNEPLKIYQESESLEFYCAEASPVQFETSALPPGVLATPFRMKIAEFEKQFGAEIYTDTAGYTFSKPNDFLRLRGGDLEIWDLSPDSRVRIAWTTRDGRDGGGGNTRLKVHATAQFSEEQATWLKQRWHELCEKRLLSEEIYTAEVLADVDHWTIQRKQEALFRALKLDDRSVANKRKSALRLYGLDDNAVKRRQRKIGEDIRSQRTPRS